MRKGKRRNIEKPIGDISNKELIDHAYWEIGFFQRFSYEVGKELLKRFDKKNDR